MNYQLIWIALIILCFPLKLAALDVQALMKAIREVEGVEGSHHTNRPGKHGERGPYQFTRSTWRRICKDHGLAYSFDQAYDRRVSDEVAEAYIADLQRLGHDTPLAVGVAWNGGPNLRSPGRKVCDYALRVRNLYDESVIWKLKGIKICAVGD